MKRALAAVACAAVTVVAITMGSDASTTKWKALKPALLERTEVSAARIGRYVYAVGGFEKTSGKTTAAVERYDIDKDRWKRVRDMPVGLNHTVAVAYKRNVYVMGGYASPDGLSTETDTLYRYRPGKNRWSSLPSAPTTRAAHTMGVIGHRLYVAGGARGGQPLDTLEIYNFKTRKWRTGPSMHTAREHLAGTTQDGFFYVLAGRSAQAGNFKVAERYDPRKREWQQLPDMDHPRGGISAVAVQNRIVVFGGEESAGTIAEVEQYDPSTKKWSRLPDMLTPRHGLGGVSRHSRVYAIEGGPTPGFDFSSAIEALDVRR